MSYKSSAKFILTLVLACAPMLEATSAATGCDNSDGAKSDCAAASLQTPPAQAPGGIPTASSTQTAASAACAMANSQDIQCLQDAVASDGGYCSCKDPQANNACKKKIQDAIKTLTLQKVQPAGSCYTAGAGALTTGQAAAADPNATTPPATTPPAKSESGGLFGGGTGTAMMMAMAGGLAGYLIAQSMNNNNNNNNNQPIYATNGTLQPDGSLNCSMSDSFNYPECDQYLMNACASTNLGTVSASAVSTQVPTGITMVPMGGVASVNCQTFNSRYCSSSVTPPSPLYDQLPNGGTEQMAVGGSGEGLGTPYCTNLNAGAFCANPVYAAQRATCPSCLQLGATNSANCAANPAACVQQYSANQIAAARTTCPSDPIFANPSNSFLGGSAVASGAPQVLPLPSSSTSGSLNTSGAPPAVLPQSSSLASARSATGSSATGGIAVSLNANLAAANGTNGRTGTLERRAASATTVASATRGPASDVVGAYGASLFSSTSQVLRQRCMTGKLNCP